MGPLKLTNRNFCGELDELEKRGIIPGLLCIYLKGLVNSHIYHGCPPPVTSEIVNQAKECLLDGIELRDGTTTMTYDVMVFIPDHETHRYFCQLIPRYPGGKLRHLQDLPEKLGFF